MADYDLIIIGGGPAGLAAAVSARKNGIDKILILERDNELGGILNQCIHNGFGLHTFQEELTEEEHAVYKRGRNSKSVSPAKNQSVTDYRRATGFEALMGYLYLKKDWERMLKLVKTGLESLEES